ncbi:unnamed protein product, partial [Laminaria digitata]
VLSQSRPPKFAGEEVFFFMWRNKMLNYIAGFGCLYVIKRTDFPVMVGDIDVSEEELKLRHSPQEIKDARLAYGLLMESITGYPTVELEMQKAKSPSGAWQALEDFYMPKTREARRRLKLEFETIRMEEGEDPLDFLGRVDKAADKLVVLGDGKSEEEVNHHIVQNLSSLFAIQKKSILSRPGIPRSEINEII